MKPLSRHTSVPSWLKRPSPPCLSERRGPARRPRARWVRTSAVATAAPSPRRRRRSTRHRPGHGNRRRAARRPVGPVRRGGRSRQHTQLERLQHPVLGDDLVLADPLGGGQEADHQRAEGVGGGLAEGHPGLARIRRAALDGAEQAVLGVRPAESGQPMPDHGAVAQQARGHHEPSVISGPRSPTLANPAAPQGPAARRRPTGTGEASTSDLEFARRAATSPAPPAGHRSPTAT